MADGDGGAAWPLTVAPGGAHWYLSIAHGQPYGRVVKYRTGTNEKVGEAEVGMFPATMEISEATGLLYVANFDLHGDGEASTVSVVEPASMTELAQVTTGAMPHGSRLAPGGRRHYSVAMMSDSLYEIDATKLKVTRALALGKKDDASSEDSTAKDTTAKDTTAKDTTAEDTAAASNGALKPTWADPHPRRPLVYVALNGADEVVEVDTDAWQVARRFPTGAGPYNLEVSPDGQSLVVSYKGAGETAIWDLDAGEEVARLENTRPVTHGVVISPDSRYAFVSAEGVGGEPGALDVFDLQQRERVASVAVGKQAGGVAFWKMEHAAAQQRPAK